MDSLLLAQVGDFAEGQFGQVTAEQAASVGVDLAELERAGFAEPVIDGVWRLRARGRHEFPRVYAAWLRLEPATAGWDRQVPASGVVSHGTALRVYRVGDEAGYRPEFTTPTPMTSSAMVHTLNLDGTDWQAVVGLPTTTPGRTLIDVAGRLDSDELGRIIDGFVSGRWVTGPVLRADVTVRLRDMSNLGSEHRVLAELVAALPG
ncbi:MAG: hypothetical protein QOE61_1842 [Micromonosporaceae bacterium]|nr:hypothetical protein [Micromonosporaceae bacterium]